MLYERSVCLFDNNSGKLFKKRTQLDVDLTYWRRGWDLPDRNGWDLFGRLVDAFTFGPVSTSWVFGPCAYVTLRVT